MDDHKTQFAKTYTEQLTKAVSDHPDEYGYPTSKVPDVVGRMLRAIEADTFSHHGRAFKETCRALKIKHTRKAIIQFWNS